MMSTVVLIINESIFWGNLSVCNLYKYQNLAAEHISLHFSPITKSKILVDSCSCKMKGNKSILLAHSFNGSQLAKMKKICSLYVPAMKFIE